MDTQHQLSYGRQECSSSPKSAYRSLQEAWIDSLGAFSYAVKLRGARQRMKAKTGRCEGRKPFGERPGEKRIIKRMEELRASGTGFDRIAASLNAEGIPTRTPGKHWHGFAVNQILKRYTNSEHRSAD
jgi:hypothetical protein